VFTARYDLNLST